MSRGTRLPTCDTLMQDQHHVDASRFSSLSPNITISYYTSRGYMLKMLIPISQIPVPGDDWESRHQEHYVSLTQRGRVMDQGHGHRSPSLTTLFLVMSQRVFIFSWVSLQTFPTELPHLGCREGKTTKSNKEILYRHEWNACVFVIQGLIDRILL